MKKLILLLSSLAIVITLVVIVLNLKKTKGKSDAELIEFSVEDIQSINQVIITDIYGEKITLIKKNEKWEDVEGGCITQEHMVNVLDAIKNIEFKGYLAENSKSKFVNLMAAQHTKVEIFQDGEWTKTWYIGPAAQDHYGQIMLLETADEGKASTPVMMQIKGVHGIIEPRFFADKRKWMCTNIFSLGLNDIKKINVRYYDVPSRSFSVVKEGANFKVSQQGKLLPKVDTAMIFRYLQNFKKVHFELPNYELDKRQIDSLKKAVCFATLEVFQTNGKYEKLTLHRIKSDTPERNEFGEYVNQDVNRLWAILPNGQVVKCQYFVFNPLLLGHIYFPMDESKFPQPKETF